MRPFIPYSSPPPTPTILTGRWCSTGPLRTNSYDRRVANVAIEYAKGTNPASARPVATPTHVLLGDADVEETIREPLCERLDHREAEVAREQDDSLVLLGDLDRVSG